jgi:hypothetical protein
MSSLEYLVCSAISFGTSPLSSGENYSDDKLCDNYRFYITFFYVSKKKGECSTPVWQTASFDGRNLPKMKYSSESIHADF